MKRCYGEIKLKKDSILYHSSDEKFTNRTKNEKPMLFCTFHPSEYGSNNNNTLIHFICLKRDVSLLFMIEKIEKNLIFSSLYLFTQNKRGNLAKMNNNKLTIFSDELKKEQFDGWVTSINNKTNIEVALLNDKGIYELLHSSKLNNNSEFLNNNINNTIRPRNWGLKYPICTIKNPAIFIINERYKEQLEKYLEKEAKSKITSSIVFQVILHNAEFYFFRGNCHNIKWN